MKRWCWGYSYTYIDDRLGRTLLRLPSSGGILQRAENTLNFRLAQCDRMSGFPFRHDKSGRHDLQGSGLGQPEPYFHIPRPLVDTFRMYLCADTDTFSQNVSVPIQIQYQKMYLCADTDTFSDTFWLYFYQNILFLKFLLNKMWFFFSTPLQYWRNHQNHNWFRQEFKFKLRNLEILYQNIGQKVSEKVSAA